MTYDVRCIARTSQGRSCTHREERRERVSDLLDSYRAPGLGRDEMVHATGTARAAWDQMADLADLHTWDQIEDARAEISTMLSDQWVRHGSDTEEAPWELDPLPVILDEVEWAGVETALG